MIDEGRFLIIDWGIWVLLNVNVFDVVEVIRIIFRKNVKILGNIKVGVREFWMKEVRKNIWKGCNLLDLIVGLGDNKDLKLNLYFYGWMIKGWGEGNYMILFGVDWIWAVSRWFRGWMSFL